MTDIHASVDAPDVLPVATMRRSPMGVSGMINGVVNAPDSLDGNSASKMPVADNQWTGPISPGSKSVPFAVSGVPTVASSAA
ncbi:MAG: hypothetical protein ACKOCK_11720, partial [Chloroflexota bacterium]